MICQRQQARTLTGETLKIENALEKNGSMVHCMTPWKADSRPNRAAVMGFTRRSHDAIIPVVSSPLLMTVDFFFLLLRLSLTHSLSHSIHHTHQQVQLYSQQHSLTRSHPFSSLTHSHFPSLTHSLTLAVTVARVAVHLTHSPSHSLTYTHSLPHPP